ncbi:hypothetical protein [Streptomyces silvisoli]|uniref:Uncharacterized protein n=1 Tax=Streptomyces silvisoli TaxID=3034235 RepID=A0ABT5ZIZ7_9ACTN|nr:hypothetical protein [Streptomyces silvisoli]MDF3289790.1 hypothetical protein [Streptomyces silvisoli]
MFGGRGIAVAAASLALLGSTLAWAPATQANAPILCSGRELTAYSPGLTLLPRPTWVRARAEYECADGHGKRFEASGRIEAMSPGSSCVQLDSPRGKEDVEYGDGRKSEIVYTRSFVVRAAGIHLVVLKGHVQEGPGEGREAVRTIQLLPEQLPTACLSPEGLQRAAGKVELRIM